LSLRRWKGGQRRKKNLAPPPNQCTPRANDCSQSSDGFYQLFYPHGQGTKGDEYSQDSTCRQYNTVAAVFLDMRYFWTTPPFVTDSHTNEHDFTGGTRVPTRIASPFLNLSLRAWTLRNRERVLFRLVPCRWRCAPHRRDATREYDSSAAPNLPLFDPKPTKLDGIGNFFHNF